MSSKHKVTQNKDIHELLGKEFNDLCVELDNSESPIEFINKTFGLNATKETFKKIIFQSKSKIKNSLEINLLTRQLIKSNLNKCFSQIETLEKFNILDYIKIGDVENVPGVYDVTTRSPRFIIYNRLKESTRMLQIDLLRNLADLKNLQLTTKILKKLSKINL